jgi:hypothetical protein
MTESRKKIWQCRKLIQNRRETTKVSGNGVRYTLINEMHTRQGRIDEYGNVQRSDDRALLGYGYRQK